MSAGEATKSKIFSSAQTAFSFGPWVTWHDVKHPHLQPCFWSQRFSVSAALGIMCGRTPRKRLFTFILRPVKQTHPRCPSVSPLCHLSSLYPSAASCPACCGAAGQIQQVTFTLLHQRTSARMFKRYFSWRGACIPFVHFISVTAKYTYIYVY